jgi:LmbE family N-acetylglucosaminyl deacetylase
VSCVLIVAPHPDDEVLGCGGAIVRHVAAGDDVYVVIVSKGVPDIFPPELVEQVRQEAAAANKVLGTKRMFFLDFPAPRLDSVPTSTLAGAIKDVIVRVQPATVYLPHHGDLHGDHKAVYWATLVASRPNDGFVPRRLLCYETPSETEWGAPIASDAFVPTVFVDVSQYLGVKLEAMKCYGSQLAPSPRARSLASIEALARVRGSTIGVPAAEAFGLIREVLL